MRYGLAVLEKDGCARSRCRGGPLCILRSSVEDHEGVGAASGDIMEHQGSSEGHQGTSGQQSSKEALYFRTRYSIITPSVHLLSGLLLLLFSLISGLWLLASGLSLVYSLLSLLSTLGLVSRSLLRASPSLFPPSSAPFPLLDPLRPPVPARRRPSLPMWMWMWIWMCRTNRPGPSPILRGGWCDVPVLPVPPDRNGWRSSVRHLARAGWAARVPRPCTSPVVLDCTK